MARTVQDQCRRQSDPEIGLFVVYCTAPGEDERPLFFLGQSRDEECLAGGAQMDSGNHNSCGSNLICTPNHPKLDHFSIETYGFGDPHFRKEPYTDTNHFSVFVSVGEAAAAEGAALATSHRHFEHQRSPFPLHGTRVQIHHS